MDDQEFDEFQQGLNEAYEEMEKVRYDAMSKVGLIRTIVVKHNKQGKESWNRSVTIVHSQLFELGLTNVGKRYCHNWLNEEWETHGDDCVQHILADKPNGLYEIVGDLYYHGWTSGYEHPEYESEIDIRDEKVQPLTFDQASRFAGDVFQEEELDLVKLIDKQSGFMDWDTQIHHYMDKLQILQCHAKALCSIMKEFWSDGSVNVKDMNVDELEAFIHMCMLDIDSRSETNKPRDNVVFVLAKKIDEEVKKTIELHEEFFNEDSTKKVV